MLIITRVFNVYYCVGRRSVSACMHPRNYLAGNYKFCKTVMATAAAPLEQQIDIIGARLGYQLQGKQKEAIIAYTSGKDTFVALPTGYGKSLIYGCLPLVFDSIRGLVPGTSLALVVCPLKALMKDQTERFRQLGITAAYADEAQVSMERFARGDFQLIFISPECLYKGRTWRTLLKSDLYKERLVAFIIDEAHLIKNW